MKTMRNVRANRGSLVVPMFLLACGGAQRAHSGYADDESKPWEKARQLRLNDNLDATGEGTLSYPDKQRAKWYVIDLPASGVLTAKVTFEPLAAGADAAVEILDAGFNVNVTGESDDDVGQPKKTREYKDARSGKSYVHLYTLGRNDKLEYTLRVHFEPSAQSKQPPPTDLTAVGNDHSGFPWTVPNLPPIAQVNAVDDTPKVLTAKKPKIIDKTPDKKPVDKLEPGAVVGSITEFSDTGSGVKIIVNRGANQGVDVGWEGYVKVKDGQPASLRVKAVRDNESDAIVKTSLDVVQNNRTVVLKPPK